MSCPAPLPHSSLSCCDRPGRACRSTKRPPDLNFHSFAIYRRNARRAELATDCVAAWNPKTPKFVKSCGGRGQQCQNKIVGEEETLESFTDPVQNDIERSRLLRGSAHLGNFRNRGIFRAMGSSSSTQSGGTASAGKQDATSEHENYSAISDTEWKQRLTKEQFNVTRKKGTEQAFTGEYWNTKTPGTYLCTCCSTPLFDSKTKFDSGTGWPSYWEPIGDHVKSETDWSIPFMPRTEVICAKCHAHLGHVFDDGPPPTGKRYCINRYLHPVVDKSCCRANEDAKVETFDTYCKIRDVISQTECQASQQIYLV